MRALVYNGPGDKTWGEVPDPHITQPTDVIVQVDTTTICGTDLHILKGDVPAVQPGRVLGHEAVGTIVEIGSAVSTFAVGDRVIVPAISSCGSCSYCKKGMPSHCQAVGGIGWVLGHLIDGTQAEYVRVPYGQTSLYRVPEGMSDQDLIFLADIFPTGYEMGVRYGSVKVGDVVAVIGVGPVGLAAVATAGFHGASKVIAVGRSQPRIDKALEMGAHVGLSSNDPDWVERLMAETRDGLGPDVVIEAVGVPDTLESAFKIVRPGGRVANAGVHGTDIRLPIGILWIENIHFTTGLVDTTSIPLFLDMMRTGKVDPGTVGTHHFALNDILDAYECFENAPKTGCLKTVLHR